MRRVLTLAPIAAFSAGCATRPWTPSTSVALYAEAPTTAPLVQLPAQDRALARWELPVGDPWARYAKSTLLASLDVVPRTAELPDVRALEVVGHAHDAALAVARAVPPADTAWFVDLRGAASVAFGTTLTRAGASVSLVPTFNNWPAESELVPAEETLAALLAMSPRPAGEAAAPAAPPDAARTTPVFLLDAWRLAYRDATPDPDVVDNRYALVPSDFPDADVLVAAGIRRIVYVVEDLEDTEIEEDDLHALFAAYQAAGIAIFMGDLDGFAKDLVPGRWDRFEGARVLEVRPRVTLLDDPRFFARARGGFGGVHGGSPFGVHAGGGHFGGGHFGGGGGHFGGGGGGG